MGNVSNVFLFTQLCTELVIFLHTSTGKISRKKKTESPSTRSPSTRQKKNGNFLDFEVFISNLSFTGLEVFTQKLACKAAYNSKCHPFFLFS